jgi:hypothetical protein
MFFFFFGEFLMTINCMQIVQRVLFCKSCHILINKMKSHHIEMLSSWRSPKQIFFKKNNLFFWLTFSYIRFNPFVDDKITKFLYMV